MLTVKTLTAQKTNQVHRLYPSMIQIKNTLSFINLSIKGKVTKTSKYYQALYTNLSRMNKVS